MIYILTYTALARPVDPSGAFIRLKYGSGAAVYGTLVNSV